MKKKIKKIFIIIALLLAVGTTLKILFFKDINLVRIIETNKTKLEKIGYSDSEINDIEESIDDEDISILLNNNYNSNYIDIIRNESFNEKYFSNYIDFIETTNLSVDDVIFVVNNNYVSNDIEYTEKTIALMRSNYYLNDRLNRYLNYITSNLNLDINDIITNVNSNLDYEYYTNVENSDTTKTYLMLVNKYYNLSSDYTPSNLVTVDSKYGASKQLDSTVYEQFKTMASDAEASNLSLYISSGYRSYSTQTTLYNNYVARDGITAANTYSAKAGYSEHQTGLAIDMTSKSTNFSTFKNSKEYTWMQENAHKYGFILRYPEGKENITGYMYEPWHYRYVGVEVATKIKELNITFEEYYAYFVK